MAKTFLELALIEYHAATFDEAAWRQAFEGIEAVVSTCADATDYLRQRDYIAFFNPSMQLEEQTETISLLTPIWSEDA